MLFKKNAKNFHVVCLHCQLTEKVLILPTFVVYGMTQQPLEAGTTIMIWGIK